MQSNVVRDPALPRRIGSAGERGPAEYRSCRVPTFCHRADVAINHLPEEQPDADEVIALIEEAGRTAVALPGDIRDESFCQQFVSDAVDQLGGLDILVNNAVYQNGSRRSPTSRPSSSTGR
ncbi:short chain dehydrogenase [Palleronia marisminoris]|uniref:Putative oxidoreductase YghA n=1 Tax=Palleronia marisminoris TaxID=315423 RepID=A0A1Y5S0A5_9RHOB|nr:SDR family NAD(P)-dependent oxidoreductase [Palleronia marisminoris]SFG39971.1 short chain dehydrogenase [Palleronia marisminoris]SLN29046.1 putative oxidoreductase YghA [Palleronia marisminoris]